MKKMLQTKEFWKAIKLMLSNKSASNEKTALVAK